MRPAHPFTRVLFGIFAMMSVGTLAIHISTISKGGQPFWAMMLHVLGMFVFFLLGMLDVLWSPSQKKRRIALAIWVISTAAWILLHGGHPA
jgi:hypothetical protein